MVAQLGDGLALGFARVPAQTQFLGSLAQLGHRHVVIVAGLAALAPDGGAPACGGRVRDAGRLLLAIALVAQLFVQPRVFERAVAASRHGYSPFPPVTGTTAPET